MAIRVAHIGTGNVGRIALNHLISDPRFELTGVWVSSDAKVGKDAGELAGLDASTGIAATNDLDALLATEPDCAVYCAMGDNRIPEAVTDVLRILAAGINVVGTSPGVFQYPWGVMPDKYIAPIEEAAQQGNSSLFISGVDPGFANDLIPFAIASTCQRIEQVRCMEIADYATYDGSTVMFDVMGFGWTLDETPMLLQPGVLGMAWGTTIRQLAAGLGIEVDEIKDSCSAMPAPEAFDIAAGHIPKGGHGRAAVRDPRHGQGQARHRHRARHPAARTTCAPTGRSPRSPAAPTGRDHRRAVVHRRHLSDQPQGRPQLRRHRGGRGPRRQRHPRGGRRAARNQDHTGPAAGHRQRLCTRQTLRWPPTTTKENTAWDA